MPSLSFTLGIIFTASGIFTVGREKLFCLVLGDAKFRSCVWDLDETLKNKGRKETGDFYEPCWGHIIYIYSSIALYRGYIPLPKMGAN